MSTWMSSDTQPRMVWSARVSFTWSSSWLAFDFAVTIGPKTWLGPKNNNTNFRGLFILFVFVLFCFQSKSGSIFPFSPVSRWFFFAFCFFHFFFQIAMRANTFLFSLRKILLHFASGLILSFCNYFRFSNCCRHNVFLFSSIALYTIAITLFSILFVHHSPVQFMQAGISSFFPRLFEFLSWASVKHTHIFFALLALYVRFIPQFQRKTYARKSGK